MANDRPGEHLATPFNVHHLQICIMMVQGFGELKWMMTSQHGVHLLFAPIITISNPHSQSLHQTELMDLYHNLEQLIASAAVIHERSLVIRFHQRRTIGKAWDRCGDGYILDSLSDAVIQNFQ